MSFYSDFAEYYEAVFPFREPVRSFLQSHLDGVGRRILDLGCGTGHYCGRLAEAGHSTLGIDLDPEMIAVARRNYPAADFRVADLREVGRLAGPFDLVYCIGNVAAHLPRSGLEAFLAGLAGNLPRGGKWVFQVVNWDRILGHEDFRFPPLKVGDEGVEFLREYRDISPDRLRFLTRLVAPGREIFAGEVELYPVRAADYLRLHEAAGFALEGHYADYTGTPFDPKDSAASVFVFRRG